MGLHRERPARPPRPDARADVVDDRDRRVRRTDLFGDAQRKIRAVDGDQAIGRVGSDGARGLADAPEQARQVADNGRKAHQRNLVGVEQRLQPQRLQMAAADADQADVAAGRRPQRRDDVGAEQVAGFLAGDHRDFQRPLRGHGDFSGGRPMTKRPSLSAASTTPAKSSTSERSASTPTPARPAAWAATIVAGPMAGRSTPQLLTGLGAFDQHAALLAGDPAMPAQTLDPFEQAVGAFDALQRHGAAADGHRRLADVERADGAGGGKGCIDVAPVSLERRHASHRSRGGQQVGHDLMRADNLDAMGFDDAGERAQQHASSPLDSAASARGRSARSARLGLKARRFGRRPMPPANTAWVAPCRLSIAARPAKFFERKSLRARRPRGSGRPRPASSRRRADARAPPGFRRDRSAACRFLQRRRPCRPAASRMRPRASVVFIDAVVVRGFEAADHR